MSPRSLPVFCVGLLALLVAVPAGAGTLYVPILQPEEPGTVTYETHVHLSNHSVDRAVVRSLFLGASEDGVRTRGTAERTAIAPRATAVLVAGDGPGLLEIRAPEGVAVHAELRPTVDGGDDVPSPVPVIWSGNTADPGTIVDLQGMRRTAGGAVSHLGLVNLGHSPASCNIAVFGVAGTRIGGAEGLEIPALSSVYLADALDIVGQPRATHVRTRVACDQPFYALLAVQDEDSGEAVVIGPSATGASGLRPPAADQPEPPAADSPEPGPTGGSVVLRRDGVVHSPRRGQATKVVKLQTPPRTSFRKVILDMDFVHGGWSREPSKSHSLFWLHRGGCCSPWPAWKDNLLGMANAWGPGKNQIRTVHDLDKPGYPSGFGGGAYLERGRRYHLRYVYDAAGGRITMTLSHRGKTLMTKATGGGTASAIRSGGSGKFMVYFGHEDARGHGPERPTYGWKYENLRVELVR